MTRSQEPAQKAHKSGFLEVSMEPPGRVEQALTFQELALRLPSVDRRELEGAKHAPASVAACP